VPSLSAPFEPLSEDQILRLAFQSLVPVLKELAGRAITHGGIRPTSLFLRDAGGTGLMLGECASTPPGYGQPLVFETIERAMAHHAGRGTGNSLDDLYAFGVTLVMLALGRNPVQDIDDDTQIATRIDRGSYSALVGGARLPQGLSEPIRGLLVDDPKQRWGINQLDLWLSGRRLSPKQTQLPKRATRPLDVAGQEAWHARGASRLLPRNIGAATLLIDSGELDRWLRRSLSDDVLADALTTATADPGGGSGKSSSLADRVVAKVAITLDPPAPIRYKGKAVLPDGLGVALADAFLHREAPQPLAEMIAWQLPLHWANQQTDFRAELVPLVQTFDSLRSLMEKTGHGYGLERALYELNPQLHCLSPMVQNLHALTPGDLLTALDGAAGSRDRGREPIDRHITAFLAARHRRTEDAVFAQLAVGIEPVRRITAMLSILADVQARAGIASVPGLCAWLAGVMEPTFARFNNRPTRESLRQQVEKAAESGRLADLLRLVDDPEAIRKDAVGFAAARRDHKKAVAEIDKLRASIADRPAIVETTGRRAAAIVSSIVGTLIAGAISLIMLVR
jgi:hypothetical protein